jgi:hypothetical protein
MAVKSQRIARTGVRGLLLVVSRALLVEAASAAASLVMEAPTAGAGAVTGAAPTFSGIASRTKAWVPARHEHDMEDSMAASSAQ